jgi:hypothetical protein
MVWLISLAVCRQCLDQYQGKESSNQTPSTRSVGMSLARRFNAGTDMVRGPRRVATIEFTLVHASLRDAEILFVFSRP